MHAEGGDMNNEHVGSLAWRLLQSSGLHHLSSHCREIVSQLYASLGGDDSAYSIAVLDLSVDPLKTHPRVTYMEGDLKLPSHVEPALKVWAGASTMHHNTALFAVCMFAKSIVFSEVFISVKALKLHFTTTRLQDLHCICTNWINSIFASGLSSFGVSMLNLLSTLTFQTNV